MSRLRSSLGPYAASMRDADPAGARRVAAELWQQKGIVVIFPDDLRGMDRDFVTAIAAKQYGKRVPA